MKLKNINLYQDYYKQLLHKKIIKKQINLWIKVLIKK